MVVAVVSEKFILIMKSWCPILLIICLVFSCSGSKNVVTETSTSKQEKKPLDTVATTTKEVIKMTDSLYVPDSKDEVEIVEESLIQSNLSKSENKKAGDTLLTKEKREKVLFTSSLSKPSDLWNDLLSKYVSSEGFVDYKSFKKEQKKLHEYIKMLGIQRSLNSFDNLTKKGKLAFWINAYNAMTIDLILRHYPIKSIKDIKNPWEQRHWRLGEKWYNLDEIEHQILRKMNEPRIHFAIVCASYSCPKLQNKAFKASNLEAQLTNATKEFLSDPERNVISKDELELSKIFQWFAKDFKQNGSLIDFLNRYSEVEISKNAKRRFKDYSWDLNE